MVNDNPNPQMEYSVPGPNPDLKSLDRLVGTWQVSGGARGQISYEWLEGGYFMIQRVELEHEGHKSQGIEVIGHEQGFGAEPGQDIKSRFYDFGSGMTLDYVYDLDGDILTIWGGERGSPAYYRGLFSSDGNRLAGSWVYPGGGYESTATRIQQV